MGPSDRSHQTYGYAAWPFNCIRTLPDGCGAGLIGQGNQALRLPLLQRNATSPKTLTGRLRLATDNVRYRSRVPARTDCPSGPTIGPEAKVNATASGRLHLSPIRTEIRLRPVTRRLIGKINPDNSLLLPGRRIGCKENAEPR